MHIYIRGGFLFNDESRETVRLGQHSRITKHYEEMNPVELIRSEMRRCKGKTLISCKSVSPAPVQLLMQTVCTNARTAEVLTQQVCDEFSDDITLRELEFRPWDPPKYSDKSGS